jgi:hypothetical protein
MDECALALSLAAAPGDIIPAIGPFKPGGRSVSTPESRYNG